MSSEPSGKGSTTGDLPDGRHDHVHPDASATSSLRRQLNNEYERAVHNLKYNVDEDLSGRSREELVQEVRRLRRTLNEHYDHDIVVVNELRDVLSNVSTGKEPLDTLQLTSVQPHDKHAKEAPSFREALEKAKKRALGGGLPGAAAMFLQVGTLMWLRTTMNYQYRHGTTTTQALRHLYKEGGIPRFYRGVLPALFQGPLSRFGDTAANAGVLSLLNSSEAGSQLPVGVKTALASAAAALWRINLMPIDTLKTIMQVEGSKGLPILMTKFKANGVRVFYQGALAASAATFAGHFPWFFTHNLLNKYLPQADTMGTKLLRNASMGFMSSMVSDTVSNSIRVVKTTKQSHEVQLTYRQTVKTIVEQDGLVGLFGRGLRTRLLANGVQGMLFTVLWKGMEERMRKDEPVGRHA